MSRKRTNILPFTRSSLAKQPISASSIDVSATSETRADALGVEALEVAVQRIVNYGKIREAFHSAQDRADRNISIDDMLAMLQGTWKLGASPDWDDAHRNWEYKLVGRDLEGDELILKIAVNVEMQLITVITKY